MYNHSVLIVDGDNFLSGVYAEKMNLIGYDVYLAGNGREGIFLAERHTPNIILLETSLRDMDGMSFLRHIRSGDINNATPVLLLSNYDMAHYDNVRRELGIYGRLLKGENTSNEVVLIAKKILDSLY